MKFGVFDHLDRGTVPLAEQYESRLKLIEAYERCGFYAYHVAEHHTTPLGMAPSPSVFLAAAAQRTRRLRFGALVYPLPMYHPLRIAEEICMLDHLSGGRLEVGVGRGVSPHELEHYGLDPAQSQAAYFEAFAILIQALTSRTLTFEGKFHSFRDVPIEIEPLQRPHPPLCGTACPIRRRCRGRRRTASTSCATGRSPWCAASPRATAPRGAPPATARPRCRSSP